MVPSVENQSTLGDPNREPVQCWGSAITGEESSRTSQSHGKPARCADGIEVGNASAPFAVNVRIEVINDPGVRNALVRAR